MGLACACAAGGALAQGRTGDADGLVETDMPVEGKTVTYFNYRGRAYRLIEPSDLRGLVVGSANLDGLPVCVEGKFHELLSPKIFRLAGSDRQFAVAEPAALHGLVRGDNVWVGGVAERLPGRPECYVRVHAVVRLKNDHDLFNSRLRKYTEERNWKKLIRLGRRMAETGRLVSGTRFEDVDRYRTYEQRAYRQALRILEEEIAPGDADAHYELARRYRELLDRAGLISAAEHLLEAVRIDPTHQDAARALREMGYVPYEGRWMTKSERDVLERKRLERLAADAGGEAGTSEGPEAVPDREELTTAERVRRLLEIEAEARTGPEGLTTAARRIPELDEPSARRIVWVLANTPGPEGLSGLLGGLKSRSSEVRTDIADALAWSGAVDGLAEMVRAERNPGVRLHAISSLSEAGTRESVDALVGLAAMDDPAARDAVRGELKRLTGKSFSGASQWRTWWRKSRDGWEGSRDRSGP